jgi:hypothetical protein
VNKYHAASLKAVKSAIRSSRQKTPSKLLRTENQSNTIQPGLLFQKYDLLHPGLAEKSLFPLS